MCLAICHEFGCENLNGLLIKMIVKLTDTTTMNSFNNMKKIINAIISNKNSKCNNLNNNNNNNYNRLLRLPIDLINNISLYLNEQDIFSFERCCKLFYQIVNSSSYVNQCNTFKTFILTQKTLDQMTQPKYSFYKYSKATTLILQKFRRGGAGDASPHSKKIKRQFEKAQIVGGHDKWLCSMFKSIKTLEVFFDGSPLLPQLPVELMFDPIKSTST